MNHRVTIGDREVGRDRPCWIIAEAGVNHNGDLNLARQLIDKAVESGADAVKFQSFVTEELIAPEAPKAGYQVETTGASGSQYEMLKALELTPQQHQDLKTYCDRSGITYLCTPYENQSVDLLDDLDVVAYKIASTDTTNLPFLRYVASKGRPVLLSTGMSTLAEVEEAVNISCSAGLDGKLVILHCTSEYPAPIEEVNLRAMATIKSAFGCPVGFSDHTLGVGASPWAVALGACVVEKHFTLNRTLKGPDHRASLEPDELRELVKSIRMVEASLGDGVKRPAASEVRNKSAMQKSLVARRTLKPGEAISAADLACKRPGSGLPPKWYDLVVGKRAAVEIPADSQLTLGSIDWG